VVHRPDFFGPAFVPIHNTPIELDDADGILREDLLHDVFPHQQSRRILVHLLVVRGFEHDHNLAAEQAQIAGHNFAIGHELVYDGFAPLAKMFEDVEVEATLGIVGVYRGPVFALSAQRFQAAVFGDGL